MKTHVPVLVQEVMELLSPKEGDSILDVTVGLGGHSSKFLEVIGSSGQLIGLDADEENLKLAGEQLDAPNVELIHSNFRKLASLNIPPQDIIFADLGLSSPHIDDASRGFSFREDGPLDLRFDRTKGWTATLLLARSSEEQIESILRKYGEIERPHKLAHALSHENPKTTGGVRLCIEEVFGYRAPRVMPQIFQALRIAVNDELGALETLLSEGPQLLKPGGRMGVISFHSLEDRMVKQAFRTLSTGIKDEITGAIKEEAPFAIRTKKPVMPSEEEIAKNQRCRSAKLRVLTRL